MPKHSNCCVPDCHNSHRNITPGVQFYCIPTDPELRKKYVVLLRNDSLKVKSPATRVCSNHWEGEQKLSRMHLPSVFPWTEPKKERRVVKRLFETEVKSCKKTRKRKKDIEDKAVEGPLPHVNMDVEVVETHSLGLTDQRMQENELNQSREVETPSREQQVYDSVNSEACDFQSQKEQENELNELRVENAKLLLQLEGARKEIRKLQRQIDINRFDICKYKASDKDIEFYTGFTSYNMLMTCFNLIEQSAKNMNYGTYEQVNDSYHKRLGRPRALSTFQEFVLVLVRLRLGLFERDLAHRFLVSESTVSVSIRTWLRFLRAEFGPLINLPSRDVIHQYSPKQFKELFPNVVIVVDCTEVEMERPSSLDCQSSCYSSYKSKPTMKSLMGITPSGVLVFVSDFFPGSASDKEITIQSGLLQKLLPGDEVMADKGFNIQDELAAVGVGLVMPAFLKGKKQFSVEESNKNKSIASLRIHVERLMERLKNWHILDRKIPISVAPYASDIIVVVGALSNFLPPLIS